MGLTISTPDQASDELGFRVSKANAKHFERIPYHDLDGSPLKDPKRKDVDFARFHVERPDGWASPLDKEGKPIKLPKYLSPVGSSVFAYFPRVDGINWEEIALNTAVEVWIVEGEFKAETICKMGQPCIGLMGVQNFGKTGEAFPYPMSEVVFTDRIIPIVFDADAESTDADPLKIEVHQAATRLGLKMGDNLGKACFLHIARTPTFKKARETDPHCKMGPDDFIHAGGTLKELRDTVTISQECEDMRELRKGYVISRETPAHVVRLRDGAQIRVADFINTLEANRIRKDLKKNGSVVKTSVAREFIEARDRPEIDRKVFWPSESTGYDPERRIFNEWRGFAVFPMVARDDEDREFRKKVKDTWTKYIKGLFGDDADYFEQWAAHTFQRPGEKTSIGIILASALNGIGKSLLGEILRGMIGQEHSTAIELDRAMSKFNAELGKKLLVQIDEADGRFSGHESKLNDMITADTMTIEKKGFDSVQIDNFVRVFLTSNSVAPIRIASENRRWFICRPDLTKAQGIVFGEWVGGEVAPLLKSAKGASALLAILLKVDITSWNPTAPVPVTEHMLDMIEAGRTKSGEVANRLFEMIKEDGQPFLVRPAIRCLDNKMWADVFEMLRINGINTMLFDGDYQGERLKGTLIDPTGLLPRTQDKEKKWKLERCSGFTSEAAFKAHERAQKAYFMVKGELLPSSKY